MRVRMAAIAAFLTSLLGPSLAVAQTGPCSASTALQLNPAWLCITPAAEYDVVEFGVPRVTELRVQFFAPGVNPATGAPTQVVSVGKPARNAQGAVWVQRAELGAIPIGQQYVATATAVNAVGESGRSAPSNPFGRSSATPPAAPTAIRVATASP